MIVLRVAWVALPPASPFELGGENLIEWAANVISLRAANVNLRGGSRPRHSIGILSARMAIYERTTIKEETRGVAIRAISFDFWGTLFTEPPGGFALYKQRRLRLLEAASRDCGNVTGAQLEAACHMESTAHEQIWRGQHRTLATAERLGRILTELQACVPDDVMAATVRAVE